VIANEHEFFAINEEEALQPDYGLKAVDRSSPWKRHIDRKETTVRANPHQFLTLGPPG
jgi:hypothetical protein